MKKFMIAAVVILFVVLGAYADTGKVLGYHEQTDGVHTHVSLIYTIQVGTTAYDINYDHLMWKKRDSYQVGQLLEVRIDGHNMYIRNQAGKEDKYPIIGSASVN